MEKRKIVSVWVSVVLVVLCVFSIGINLWLIINGLSYNEKYNALSLLDVVFFTASSILALVYCFKGYKKDANKIFKLCSIVFTIALLLQVAYKALPKTTLNQEMPMSAETDMPSLEDGETLPLLRQYENSILIITSAIMFGNMMVLTFAENLGKKKSMILIGIVLVSSLVAACATIDSHRLNTIILNVNFGTFINAVIYGIMVYAKYQDKEARGTK